MLALGLAKEEAIQNWRNMLGPKEVEVAKQEAPDRLVRVFGLLILFSTSVPGACRLVLQVLTGFCGVVAKQANVLVTLLGQCGVVG